MFTVFKLLWHVTLLCWESDAGHCE